MKLYDELRCEKCGQHPFEVVEVDEDDTHRFTCCVTCGQPVPKVVLVVDNARVAS